MIVILAFDDVATPEATDPGDAFWLVSSASNRKTAEIAWRSMRFDENSAIFDPPSGEVGPADVIGRLSEIDLHHPDWREIRLSGVPWTEDLQAALEERSCVLEPSSSGIVLKR